VEWLGGYEFRRRGVVLRVKCQGGSATSFRFKEMGITHGTKPLSLPNDSFTLLNAELNNKQLMKRAHIKGLTLPQQRLENIIWLQV
jgi:hypothetical protein